MTPEQQARQNIDRQLEACGWIVQDYKEMNISAGLGVAVREFPLKSGHGRLPALRRLPRPSASSRPSPKGTPSPASKRSPASTSTACPPTCRTFALPLPFAYESTGTVTQFTNALEPDARSRDVFTFHRPEELIRLATLERQMRGAAARDAAARIRNGSGACRSRASRTSKRRWPTNRPRSLIQMATGSGKTYTAVILLLTASSSSPGPGASSSWWTATTWASRRSTSSSSSSARTTAASSPRNTASST